MISVKPTYTVQEQLVETSFGSIHVLECGDKENQLLLILHGYDEGESNHDWRWILPFLAEAGFHVIAPSMPGFGKSPGPRSKSRSEYHMLPGGPVSILDELITLFDDDDAVLIGYDWGAGIILSFAARFPEKVITAILFHITFTDYGGVLERIKCENLILWVKSDIFHPYANGLKFKNALKKSQFVTLNVGQFKEDKMNENYRYIGGKIVSEMVSWLRTERIWENHVKALETAEKNLANKPSEKLEEKKEDSPQLQIQVQQDNVPEKSPIQQQTEKENQKPSSINGESIQMDALIKKEESGKTEEPITQINSEEKQQEELALEINSKLQSALIDEEDGEVPLTKGNLEKFLSSQKSVAPELKALVDPLNKQEKEAAFDVTSEKSLQLLEMTKTNSFEVKKLTRLKRKVVPQRRKPVNRPKYNDVPLIPMKTDIGELEVVKTRGGDVVVTLHGPKNGIPYFILHGWEPTAYSGLLKWLFDPIAKEGFRVIAPDMPGFGRSVGRRHNCRSEANFDEGGPMQIMEDLIKHYNIKNFWTFGFSWGGGISISLALIYPTRCQKLTLYMPSYTEQKSELKSIKQDTFIMWVPVDQIHPVSLGRYFKKVIPKVTYAEVDVGKYRVGLEDDEYGQFSDKLLAPLLAFIRKNK
mgnify:CR=1 FL=1